MSILQGGREEGRRERDKERKIEGRERQRDRMGDGEEKGRDEELTLHWKKLLISPWAHFQSTNYLLEDFITKLVNNNKSGNLNNNLYA